MTKAFAVALLAALHGAALAQDRVLTGSVGADYTSGDYGQDEKTEIRSLSFAAKYEVGRWTYRASLPVVRITGPSNVVGSGEGSVTLPGADATRRSVTGLGDAVFGASYLALHERSAPFLLELGGKVKLGTGDEDEGLGTGKHDFSLQADAFKAYGAFTPFATLGYRWYGDPEGIDLRNVLYGSLGGVYRISAATTAGLAYDGRDRIVDGGARVSELVAFVSHALSPEMKLQIYVVKGFADASPDRGFGAVVSTAF